MTTPHNSDTELEQLKERKYIPSIFRGEITQEEVSLKDNTITLKISELSDYIKQRETRLVTLARMNELSSIPQTLGAFTVMTNAPENGTIERKSVRDRYKELEATLNQESEE